MIGICIISHENGWAITNEAKLDEDKYFDPVQKIVKGDLTLKLFHIFDYSGEVSDGQRVECLFKTNERKEVFLGTVKARRGNLTIIEKLVRSDNYNETLKKIRK